MRRIVQLWLVFVALLGASVAPNGLAGASPQRPEAPAQAPPTPTMKVYGMAGTFGSFAGMTLTASGQSVATQSVANWTFPAGREF